MEEGEASTHHLEAPDTTPIVPVARAVPLPPPETRGGGGRNQSQTTTVRDQRRGTTDPGWYESYWGVVGALFIEGAVLIGIGIPLAIIIAGVGAIIGGLFYWALALLMAVTFPVWAILEWIVWKPFLWVLERTFGVVEIPASRAWEWMRARARQPVERFGQTRIANTRTGHVIRRASTPVGVVAGLAIVAIAVFAALTSAGAIGDKGAAGRGPQELSADPYAAAAADYESYFQTPSRNIRCSYTSRYVSCHVRSTGQTVSIHAHGVVRFETRPPKFPYPITDVAAYGNERYAETAGITCYSKSSGLTCLARNNTGFEADRSGVHLVGED